MTETRARSISLIPMQSLAAEMQAEIRTIRNNPDVRRWMYTDHLISETEHGKWLTLQSKSHSDLYFGVVEDQSILLGVVSANRIDTTNKRCDWAFYLSNAARGGLGSCLEFAFINFIFDTLKLEKLDCEVIEGNDAVIGLHKKFLFKQEGFRESEIFRDGKRLGIYFLGLTRECWTAGKDALVRDMAEKLARFKITVVKPASIKTDD